ncbi:MAG: hypothetical protein ABEK36_05290 [Candidatus Aenigmatarchaeota archaeon]
MAELSGAMKKVITALISTIVLPVIGNVALSQLNTTYPTGSDNRYVYTLATYAIPIFLLALWVGLIYFAMNKM